jgi:hypothetical protein
VIYEFIRAEKAIFPVSALCQVLRVSRSGFYSWHRGERSKRELSDRRLLVEIKSVFEASRRTYGSPRVYDELRKKGLRCSLARVERLMREHGITPPTKRKFRKTTDSDHRHAVAPNLLDRDFTSPSPNRRWSTDITYVWTSEGWLYLAIVMDLFSRRIVGWSMRNTLARPLVLSALSMALGQRNPDSELLHHSDNCCIIRIEDLSTRVTTTRRNSVADKSRAACLGVETVGIVRIGACAAAQRPDPCLGSTLRVSLR